MKKGFATSGILYTVLLLFVALLFGVLQNLQNKKTILDQLKIETVDALNCDCSTLLNKIEEAKQKFTVPNTRTEVNITDYKSERYVFPENGYVFLYSGWDKIGVDEKSRIWGYIYDPQGQIWAGLETSSFNNYGNYQLYPVLKGYSWITMEVDGENTSVKYMRAMS